MKNEKSITITPPEGYEIDKEKSTLEKIVFRALPDLPKTWEELGFIKGYYVDVNCDIQPMGHEQCVFIKDVWPTREEAEASIAFAQLCQLRDRYNGGWKPDWNDSRGEKYTIFTWKGKPAAFSSWEMSHALVFKTKELRDRFLENFRDLIEKAKPLL